MQSTTQISTPHVNNDQSNSDMPELAFIPLAKLDIHPHNVRKTPLYQQEQDEITASIGHQGLIEPLVCIPAANNPDTYLVIAGGRRLTSLHMLDEASKLPSNLQQGIPCQILPEDVDVTLLSMTENNVRFSMNPADQIVAWRDLFANGYAIDDIANRFGQHPKLVQ